MPPTLNIENDPTGLVGVDADDRLYTMKCGAGFSCLGFDVCEEWTRAAALTIEMPDLLPLPEWKGTPRGYHTYVTAMEELRRSGRKCLVQLIPQLIGLEGMRVEVIDCYGEKRRFYVGKSMGWMPCHLEIALRNSHGGHAVTGAPFKSLRVVGTRGSA